MLRNNSSEKYKKSLKEINHPLEDFISALSVNPFS
jgi:hypothetical protein